MLTPFLLSATHKYCRIIPIKYYPSGRGVNHAIGFIRTDSSATADYLNVRFPTSCHGQHLRRNHSLAGFWVGNIDYYDSTKA